MKTQHTKMMSAGMNGFGRFGLHLLKYWLEREDEANFHIAYINDDTLTLQDALRIIKTDTFIKFPGIRASARNGSLVLERPGKSPHVIRYSNEPQSRIPWVGKPDIVLECSGKGTEKKKSVPYLRGNTRQVIISATSWDADKTILYGFNHDTYHPRARVVSYGSCTVNAYVPFANYLHKKYGVANSDINFIHNVPEYQLAKFNTLERRACSLERSGVNLLSFLNTKNFTINYTLVPYPGVSMFDFRFSLKKKVTKAELLRDVMRACTKGGSLANLYGFEDTDTGPEKHKCTPFSAIFIKDHVRVLNNNVYLHGYFDNENSVNRYFDVIQHICAEIR